MEKIYVKLASVFDVDDAILASVHGDYNKAIQILNKKYLDVLQGANTALHTARIGQRDYTYTKTNQLAEAEATKAIQFGIRVDAISEHEDYHGTYKDAYQKIRIKNVRDFYDNRDNGMYSTCEPYLYLSPDYEMGKIDTKQMMEAIRYFVAKEAALKEADIVEMPTFYMMIGMPGCGKSTLSAKLPAEVYSSDAIRKELTGSVFGETKGAIEFRVMNLRTQQALLAGLDAICDATALSKKSRASAMRNVKNVPHKTVGCFFNCLREESSQRNLNPDRDKNVPEEDLERLWNSIEVPTLDEGFDELYDILVIV